MKQKLLNESYGNQILEAYQKISDTFDDFTQRMRKSIADENMENHLKIAAVSKEMMRKHLQCDPSGIKLDSSID